MANFKTKGFETENGDTYDIIPPAPESNVRGGIAAEAKTVDDKNYTLEVKVDPDTSKAYVLDKVAELGLSIDDKGRLCFTINTEEA